MDNVIIHRTPDYLKHHGIIGQKWGVMHGPPYPLGANDSRSVSAKGQRSDPKYYDAEKPKMANRKGSSSKKSTNNAVVRKQNQNKTYPVKRKESSKQELTAEERKARNKKIAKYTAIGLASAAAIGLTAYSIKKKGGIKGIKSAIEQSKRTGAINDLRSIQSLLANDALPGECITMKNAANDFEKNLIKEATKVNFGSYGHKFMKGRASNCGWSAVAFDNNIRGNAKRIAKGAKEGILDPFGNKIAGIPDVGGYKVAAAMDVPNFEKFMSDVYDKIDDVPGLIKQYGAAPTTNRQVMREINKKAKEAGVKGFREYWAKQARDWNASGSTLNRVEQVAKDIASVNGGNSSGILRISSWNPDQIGHYNVRLTPHIINYVCKNGSVYFIDTQTRTVMNPNHFATRVGDTLAGLMTYRTDTVGFNSNGYLNSITENRNAVNVIKEYLPTNFESYMIKDISAAIVEAGKQKYDDAMVMLLKRLKEAAA